MPPVNARCLSENSPEPQVAGSILAGGAEVRVGTRSSRRSVGPVDGARGQPFDSIEKLDATGVSGGSNVGSSIDVELKGPDTVRALQLAIANDQRPSFGHGPSDMPTPVSFGSVRWMFTLVSDLPERFSDPIPPPG